MADPACPSDRINSYSLVGYIPGELGEFITRLRQELVRSCVAQSHVTILPPRPLSVDSAVAETELKMRVAVFPPFQMDLPRLRVFEETSVIFAEIGTGRQQVLEMHDALATGPFAFDEPWYFHPHVTLAQGIDREQVSELYDYAVRRWNESAPSPSVCIDTLTFVQNTIENRWVDLAECELRGALAGPVR